MKIGERERGEKKKKKTVWQRWILRRRGRERDYNYEGEEVSFFVELLGRNSFEFQHNTTNNKHTKRRNTFEKINKNLWERETQETW